MNLRYSSSQDGNMPLTSITEDMAGMGELDGQTGFYTAGQFGVMLCWQVTGGAYQINTVDYTIEESTYLHCQDEVPVLQAIICMEGEAHFIAKDAGCIKLQKGQFNIFYQPIQQLTGVFDSLTRVQILTITFPVALLNDLAVFFPIGSFIENITCLKPSLMFETPGWITSDFITDYTWLQYNPKDKLLASYLLDKQIRVLMFMLMRQKFYTGKLYIEPIMLESIREARHLIEVHLGSHLTIDAVAQCVNLSVHDLRRYFKEVTGSNPAELIAKSRLHNAKLLLLDTNKTIKEIAALCGYDHQKNFITAFQNAFGYGPSFYRKGM